MYRTIDCDMWRDPWFSEIEPSAKLLFIYLVTNPHTNQAGILETTIRSIAFDTGLPASEVGAIIESFGDRVVWWPEHHTLWIRNFIRRQKIIESPKLAIVARKVVAALPTEIRNTIEKSYPALMSSGDTLSIPYPEGSDTFRARNRAEQSRTVSEQSRAEQRETAPNPAPDNGADAPPSPATNPRSAPKPKQSTIPDDFAPAEKDREWAESHDWPAAWIESQTEQFALYYQANAKRMTNWGAAWRKWMLKGADMSPPWMHGASGTARASPRSRKDEQLAILDDYAYGRRT